MIYPLKYIGITQNYHTGKAVDFGWNSNNGGKNQPIYSIDNGTIIYKKKEIAGGNILRIKHTNGYVSEYAHLKDKSIVLNVGNKVIKGQQIALMGDTGSNQTGNHLHFALYKNSIIKPSNQLPCLEFLQYDETNTIAKSTIAKGYKLFAYGEVVTCIANKLRVRNKPSLLGSTVGYLYKGNEVKVYDIVEGWYKTSPNIQRWSASKYLERR